MFDLEAHLVEVLLPALSGLFPGAETLVFAPEVTHHSRVVDLVVCDADDPRASIAGWADYGRAMRSLTKSQLSVLALIWSEGPVAIDRLARLSWMAPEDLERRYVAPMVRAGLVDRRRSGTLQATSWSDWEVNTIVAIEAKLVDWRGVIEQASQNAIWADYSFVAMPDDGVLIREPVRAALRGARVGAIAVGPESGARIVARPKRGALTLRRRRSQFAAGLLTDLLSGQRWAAIA